MTQRMGVVCLLWVIACHNNADFQPPDDLTPDASPVDAQSGWSIDAQMDAQIDSAPPPIDAAPPPPPKLLYVNSQASGGNVDCTIDKPCRFIGYALTRLAAKPIRNIIEISAGLYDNDIDLPISNARVEIRARGVILQNDNGAMNRQQISVGENADLTIVGMTLINNSPASGAGAWGISCSVMGGIRAKMKLEQVTLSGSAKWAITSWFCDVTMNRVLITNNFGGGIHMIESGYNITNTVIVHNADQVGIVPQYAVWLEKPTTDGDARFEFNSVAYNGLGIACGGADHFRNSILWANSALPKSQVTGSCVFDYSTVGPWPFVGGVGNSNVDPHIRDDGQIPIGSPVIDAADPFATMSVDYYGTARPIGVRRDMGAVEVQ